MDSLSALILAGSLFIIMLGMGLSLTTDDFKRVIEHPKAVLVGFIAQIALLPILAFLLIQLLGVAPNIAIGVMILASCPGGPTSNLLSYLAKADVALSVTLTAINSLVSIISIPLIVNFSLTQFSTQSLAVEAPIGQIIGSLIVVILIPLSLGMLLKRYKASLAEKVDKPIRIASSLLLVLIIVGLCIKEKENLPFYFANSLVIVLSLNILTMTGSFFLARLAKLNLRQALTICIEGGNQNGTLAIHIAVVSLASPTLAIAAAVYSLIMYFTASIPIFFGHRIASRQI